MMLHFQNFTLNFCRTVPDILISLIYALMNCILSICAQNFLEMFLFSSTLRAYICWLVTRYIMSNCYSVLLPILSNSAMAFVHYHQASTYKAITTYADFHQNTASNRINIRHINSPNFWER